MVKHLWEKFAEPMQSKENDASTRKRIDPALLHLVEAMQGVWGKENPLEEAQELVSTAVEARETKKKENLESSRQKIRVAAKKKNWVHRSRSTCKQWARALLER